MFQSDDDSGNESDSSERSGKRKRFDDEAIERRREKRLWEEQRCLINYLLRLYALCWLRVVIVFKCIYKCERCHGRVVRAAQLWCRESP